MANQQTANGADEQNERRRSGGSSPSRDAFQERGRQIQGDAQKLVSHVQEASGELQTYIQESVRERPMTTLAAAAGVGFLLGGGLSSRLTVLMLGLGTRFAMAVAAREMSSWATGQELGAPPTQTRH
jgi:ElaB/YqjD/DUF883 family membrane-anchored ribosome-binding protein